MRATVMRLARMTAGYSLVSLMGPIFTVFLTPLYTRVLVPADYGVVDVTLTLGNFVSIFAVLAVDQAMGAYFNDGDEAHKRNLVTTAAVFVVAMGLLAALLLAVAAIPLAEGLFKSAERRNLILLLALGMVGGPAYGIAGAGLRLHMEVKRVNLLALTAMLLTVGGNILLVLVFQMGAAGILLANAVVNVATGALGLWLARRLLSGRFSVLMFRSLLRTGLGLLPGSLGFLLSASADRLLLTQFVSQSDLGLYSIAVKLASMVWVGLSPAWNAWYPLALEIADKPDSPRQYARVYEYLFAASVVLALGIGIFSPEILQVFTRSIYVPAAPYALVLMMCVGPITVSAFCFQIGLYVRKRTHLISPAYLLAAAVNIVTNLALDPFLGVWGAMWANVLGSIALVGWMYATGQRAAPVPYRWLRISALGAVYLVLMLAFLFTPAIESLAIKLAALAVLVVAIVGIGIVSPREIRQVISAVRVRLARARSNPAV